MNKQRQNYYPFYLALFFLAATLAYFSLKHPLRKANLYGIVESPKISIDHPRKVFIEKVQVSPGQRVTKGMLLMELSSVAIEDDLESVAFTERQLEAIQEKEVYEVEIEKNELNLQLLQEKMAWEQGKRELALATKRDDIWLKDFSSKSQPDSLSPSFWQAGLLDEEYRSKLAEIDLRQKLLRKKRQLLESTFKAGKAELELKRQRLLTEKASLQLKAPAGGTIDNVYFMEGQTAEGFSELLSLLPDDNKFVRAYVTEQRDFDVSFTDVLVQSQVQLSGKEIFFKLDSSEGWLHGEKVMILFK